MFPNPQEALPLPPRPNVAHYRKLAKDLVKACQSGDPDAISSWALRWIHALAACQSTPDVLPARNIKSDADEVAQFARKKLSTCVLADAQFVIARSHGFLSWPIFVTHLDALAIASSPTSTFETAADAIVNGDIATVERLLRDHPALIRARSAREHRATLLHYVAANGVEGYRQVSPKNIAAIAEVLLEAGADVDAGADVYGGHCTALGLVATSTPPEIAGVQKDVIDVLLRHGARMDRDGSAGRNHTLVFACLMNGQPGAAEYLASRGAPLDLAGAAGIGRLDDVKRILDGSGAASSEPNTAATRAHVLDAFSLACAYGRTNVVELLLGHGVEVDAELRGHGDGHTGLHVAAFHARTGVVDLLLRRGARIDAIDKTWGTPPLVWALTGWKLASTPRPERYYDVVARLVAAGAHVTQDLLGWDEAREDPQMLAALGGQTGSDSV